MRSIKVTRGRIISYQGQNYEVVNIIDLYTVLGAHTITGEHKRIPIKSAKSADKSNTTPNNLDLVTIPDSKWEEAQRRFEAIHPLITGEMKRTAENMQARSEEYQASIPTLYRWIRAYEEWPELISLVPKEKTGGKGKSRMTKEQEDALEKIISDVYLAKQKKKVSRVFIELELYCREHGIPTPHINTLRNRIHSIPDSTAAKKREGAKSASKWSPVKSEFPGGNYPLEVVQIDHTPLDLIIVDDEHRLSINRPMLTLGIDVYSRMVTGFCLSLEAPSSMSVGLCISHSVLPKESYLNQLGIKGEWPLWGLMKTVHVDNAKEFRSKYLERSGENYGMAIEFRPVARPNFGGHIERLLGTFLSEIHSIKGTTFSTTHMRGEYDSDGKAIMTLKEAEQWLATYITEIYHKRIHTSLGTTPLAKFESGILGSGTTPGVGLPRRITDERKFNIDFLPLVERTIQRYGVKIDNIFYYHDCLRQWILSEEKNSGKKKVFSFRRDPRDISVIYFYDPELKEYFEIPYRNITHPPMTLWELREAQERLKSEGEKAKDEDAIFAAYKRLIELEESSSQKTKKQRRAQQRKKVATESKNSSKISLPKKDPATIAVDDDIFENALDIQPYDEIDQ